MSRGLQCTLSNLHAVQLQPSPHGSLQLTLNVDKTIAFYVWRATCIQPGSGEIADVSAHWYAAAQVLAADPNWSTLRLARQDAAGKRPAIPQSYRY